MNLHEVFIKTKLEYDELRPRGTYLDNEISLSDIVSAEIEDLSISTLYKGDMPNLNNFSNLKCLYIYRPIDAEYLKNINLFNLESLYIYLNNMPFELQLDAPNLNELTISINDNTQQLDLFTLGERILDISKCINLKSLTLRSCTGLQVYTNGKNLSLKTLDIANTMQKLNGLITSFPNIEKLIVRSCGIDNIDFIQECKNIKLLCLPRNSIKEVDMLLKYPYLDVLDIYGNPIDNILTLNRLICKKLIYTEKDYAFERFDSDLAFKRHISYQIIIKARNEHGTMNPYKRKFYDIHTDEEIFYIFMCEDVKKVINEHLTKKLYGKEVRLTISEMKEHVLQEYPFLQDTLKDV